MHIRLIREIEKYEVLIGGIRAQTVTGLFGDIEESKKAYDSNPYVCGMGKDNLFAKGEI